MGFSIQRHTHPLGRGAPLPSASHRLAKRDKEHGAVALGVRREEIGDVVIVEREAGCAQALGVGREVELAADDACFELRGALAPIAEALQDPF